MNVKPLLWKQRALLGSRSTSGQHLVTTGQTGQHKKGAKGGNETAQHSLCQNTPAHTPSLVLLAIDTRLSSVPPAHLDLPPVFGHPCTFCSVLAPSMHSQVFCLGQQRNAQQLVRSCVQQHNSSRWRSRGARLVSRAVETQQQPPASELAPLPWTGDAQQQQVRAWCQPAWPQQRRRNALCYNRTIPRALLLLQQTTCDILCVCVQALQQLRTRLSKGGSAPPSEETMQWFLRDRYSDCAAMQTPCTRCCC
jgi:hypothetical protein